MAHYDSAWSDDHLDTFWREGFVGPLSILSAEACGELAAHLESGDAPSPDTWWKGLAVSDRAVYEISTLESILIPVRSILGDEVILWGAQYLRRDPGQLHAWHADIEPVDEPAAFVTVWLGIRNVTSASGLAFASGSHLIGKTLQQVAKEQEVDRQSLTDHAVATLVGEEVGHRQPVIVRPHVGDGDALVFTGGTWHASLNTTGAPRTALLLQYTKSGTPVAVPDHHHLEWPFKKTATRAPSLVVSGHPPHAVHDLRTPP